MSKYDKLPRVLQNEVVSYLEFPIPPHYTAIYKLVKWYNLEEYVTYEGGVLVSTFTLSDEETFQDFILGTIQSKRNSRKLDYYDY
jgi:hypothetical protein